MVSLVLAWLAVALADITLLPTDPRVAYEGRFDWVTDPQAPRFSWVQTGMKCTVSNSDTVMANLTSSSTGDRFAVLVDEKLARVVLVQHKPVDAFVNYVLVTGLSISAHTIAIYKITEDNAQKGDKGVVQFGGFSVAPGGTFGPQPTPKTRKLEFIGDSDTAGWWFVPRVLITRV